MIRKNESSELVISDIQKTLWFGKFKHIVVLNSFFYSKDFESDFAYITPAGYSYEIEIKRDYQDFKADFNKSRLGKGEKKHDLMLAGQSRQNYFSFCFNTEALAKQCLPEIPEKYGCCYVDDYYVYWMRNPQKLNKNKVDWEYMMKRMGVAYQTKVFPML